MIIQTAFIGDVILATVLIEALSVNFPEAKIDFILRRGNEKLLLSDPRLNRVLIWDKSRKFASMFEILRECNKSEPYDILINLQRFFTTGLMASMIKADIKIGFDKNPLSVFMNHKIPHEIGNSKHERERNLETLKPLGIEVSDAYKVKLYPGKDDKRKAEDFAGENFVTISPASVWFTKQLESDKWISLIQNLPEDCRVLLMGGPGDTELCQTIKDKSGRENIINLAGKTTFLETAAIMKLAILNYTNDSAPLHLASSQNANTCSVFCSTIPEFGFGPLSDFSKIVQVEGLKCKPCGLHGYRSCPEGHFKCSGDLEIKKLLNAYNEALNFKSGEKETNHKR